MPYFYNHRFGSSGTPIARHFGSRYPFGHGLSYTSFAYADLKLEADRLDCASGTVSVSFAIKNTGKSAGTAVPQLYVCDRLASVARPIKELKAFARLDLAPGEEKRVSFKMPTDMLNFTGRDGRRQVEPGMFDLMIGESSGDIRLKTAFELTGDVFALSGKWRMTSSAEIS